MNDAIAVVASLSLLTSIGTIIGLVMKFSTKEDYKELKDSICASENRSDKKIDDLKASIIEQNKRYDDLVNRINVVGVETREVLSLIKVQNHQFDMLNNQLKGVQEFLIKTDEVMDDVTREVAVIKDKIKRGE